MGMAQDQIISYLNAQGIFRHPVTYEKINVGASGAKLFLLTDGERKYVLKNAHPSYHSDAGHIASYQRELAFYRLNRKNRFSFVPETLYLEDHPDYGVLLVMRYYRPIQHAEWNEALLHKAVDLCARLHSTKGSALADLGLRYNHVAINREATNRAFEAWKQVARQHEGALDPKIIDGIYRDIEVVCPVLNAEPHFICHGDFHPENILTDGETLFLCDWQGIGIGKGIGDISFFISRALGFGIALPADGLLDCYCSLLSQYRNETIDKQVLLKEKAAANLLNTFSFWAYHLQNRELDRVLPLYRDMAESYHYLRR